MSYEIEVILDPSQSINIELNESLDSQVELLQDRELNIEIENSLDIDIDYTNVLVSIRGVTAGLSLEVWDAPGIFDALSIETLGESSEIMYTFETPLTLRLDQESEINLEMP